MVVALKALLVAAWNAVPGPSCGFSNSRRVSLPTALMLLFGFVLRGAHALICDATAVFAKVIDRLEGLFNLDVLHPLPGLIHLSCLHFLFARLLMSLGRVHVTTERQVELGLLRAGSAFPIILFLSQLPIHLNMLRFTAVARRK